MVGSLVVIPWTIKPLYGFFTDNFPVPSQPSPTCAHVLWPQIAGMQRVPYIAIAFAVVSVCWFVMAYGVNSVMAYVLVVRAAITRASHSPPPLLGVYIQHRYGSCFCMWRGRCGGAFRRRLHRIVQHAANGARPSVAPAD